MWLPKVAFPVDHQYNQSLSENARNLLPTAIFGLEKTFMMMVQVLKAATNLSKTPESADSQYLKNLLGSTAAISSCDQIDDLITVLSARRADLEVSAKEAQLQLLHLFLWNSRCALHR